MLGRDPLNPFPSLPGEAKAAPKSHLDRVAITLHSLFSHVDLTLSDYATALLLVGIRHRVRKEERASDGRYPARRDPQGGDVETGEAGADPRAAGEGDVYSLPANQMVGTDPSASSSSRGSPDVDIEMLRDAVHYFKHACAVFGWPMHVWMTIKEPSRCEREMK